MIVRALVSPHLAYSDSLFTYLSKSSFDRLQLIQNAAARLLTRSSRFSHFTFILASLHWLPVHFRIHFKILVITCRAFHIQALAHISDLLHPYVDSRSLGSSSQDLLVDYCTRMKERDPHTEAPNTENIYFNKREWRFEHPALHQIFPCTMMKTKDYGMPRLLIWELHLC